MKFRDTETGKETFTLKGRYGYYVRSVAFSPDGTIKIWHAPRVGVR